MTTIVPINVHTHDREVSRVLVNPDDGQMTVGETKAEIEDETVIVYDGSIIRKSLGIPEIVQFSLMMGGNIACSVIAAWLYERLKDREVTLEIGGEEIEVDKESIQTKLDEFQK